MSTSPSWRRYARFWGARVDADVDAELEFHIALLERDYRARGMSAADARAAALQRLGNVARTRDACRAIGRRRQRRAARAETIGSLAQDGRYALRTFARQRGWAAVALLTLALGIGATTAMFSVVNSLVLHPLSYVGADRVRLVWLSDPKTGVMIGPPSALAKLWAGEHHAFDAMESYRSGRAILRGERKSRVVQRAEIGSGFLTLAGVQPIRGRAFSPEEQRPGGSPVALISAAMWQQDFGGAADVVGKVIILDDRPTMVIGVLPSSLRLPGVPAVDVWEAIGANPANGFGGAVVARLRRGVNAQTAEHTLDSITARAGPLVPAPFVHFSAALRPPSMLVSFAGSLYLLSGAVVVLLLVACANVAHLLAVRSAVRSRELAIRGALGAGRGRLFRQLLTESLILAAAGGIVGILLSYVTVNALVALAPKQLSQLAMTSIDGRALATSLIVALATGLIFGAIASLHALRDTAGELLHGPRGTSNGAERGRLRAVLVVTETAMSAILLVGGVLVVRSVRNLQHTDPHFDARSLYYAQVELPRRRAATPAAERAEADAIIQDLRRIRGVVRATATTAEPGNLGFMVVSPVSDAGVSLTMKARAPLWFVSVASDYFELVGLRLIRGRTFTESASDSSAVIINRGFARALWPGQSVVGRRMNLGGGIGGVASAQSWRTVIGVVDDAPNQSLASDPAAPTMYTRYGDQPLMNQVDVVLRVTEGIDPRAAIKHTIAAR